MGHIWRRVTGYKGASVSISARVVCKTAVNVGGNTGEAGCVSVGNVRVGVSVADAWRGTYVLMGVKDCEDRALSSGDSTFALPPSWVWHAPVKWLGADGFKPPFAQY
jgi:hypothetical protein